MTRAEVAGKAEEQRKIAEMDAEQRQSAERREAAEKVAERKRSAERREVAEKALAKMVRYDPVTMKIEQWVRDFDGMCIAIRHSLENLHTDTEAE